jgi:tRNA (guanosine-2'-O-)-methyltransferase
MYTYNEDGCNNTDMCFRKLRDQGYRIIATTPHERDVTLPELSVSEKTALVFGAELTGLSDYAMSHADGFVRIPMFGFSESYNISVSAALCLYELTLKVRREGIRWQLTNGEQTDLKLRWLKKSIRASRQLERKFLKEQGIQHTTKP